VKPWKVILATLVIFIAGLITGAVLVKKTQPRLLRPTVSYPSTEGPEWIRQRFFERMKNELNLTAQQTRRLKDIFEDGRERVHELYEVVAPGMRTELSEVRERIHAELSPKQQKLFEELVRSTRSSRYNPQTGDAKRSRYHGGSDTNFPQRQEGGPPPGSGGRRGQSNRPSPSSLEGR
jgi:hypothetical protein